MATAKQIKVTQIRSGIGGTRRQRETLKSLGLRKIRQSVVLRGQRVRSRHDCQGGAPRHR